MRWQSCSTLLSAWLAFSYTPEVFLPALALALCQDCQKACLFQGSWHQLTLNRTCLLSQGSLPPPIHAPKQDIPQGTSGSWITDVASARNTPRKPPSALVLLPAEPSEWRNSSTHQGKNLGAHMPQKNTGQKASFSHKRASGQVNSVHLHLQKEKGGNDAVRAQWSYASLYH